MPATPSRKRLIILCSILLLLGFTCFGYIGYQVYRTWDPWYTQDINDYPEMRERLVSIYPQTPDILLPSIPNNATEVQFIASPIGGLRAPPIIELVLTLPPEAAQAELQRLRSLEADRKDFTASIDDDGIIYFNYHLGSQGTYTTDAVVSYDPKTNTFGYRLGAGY